MLSTKPDKTIILAAACVLCVMVIAVLIGMNLIQKSQYDQAVRDNQSYSRDVDGQIADLRSQIQSLQAQKDQYQSFILTNRSPNVERQINLEPGYPNVTRIACDENSYTIYFADGTSKTGTFPAIP